MEEVEQIVGWLSNKEKLAAMLAPSFPVVFSYPQIVGKLRRVGFTYVVEVAVGASWTNDGVIKALKKDDKTRIITAPCPSIVRIIKSTYPHLVKYLAMGVDSPMVATAKLLDETGINMKKVFIGPCVMKKKEAGEDRKELAITVITYEELKKVFEKMGVKDEASDERADFDWRHAKTRLYPISGGLAQSSEVRKILSTDEISVVSGWKNCKPALDGFEESHVRLLDILNCDGGCISGPGIVSDLSLNERRARVIKYWERNKVL